MPLMHSPVAGHTAAAGAGAASSGSMATASSSAAPTAVEGEQLEAFKAQAFVRGKVRQMGQGAVGARG